MTTDWSYLPGDILTSIAKVLNSDLHCLRLRAVCSSWRTSLPLPKKRLKFPLKVPALYTPYNGYFILNQNTIYRLSTPDHASDVWIFKVSETIDDNTFSPIIPLSVDKIKSPPGLLPKHLNILNYRISEICKSYNLAFVDIDNSCQQSRPYLARKVIALWNYVVDCEFVALVLNRVGDLDFWILGDVKWNKIYTVGKRVCFQDIFIYEGKCYAIDIKGVLMFIDSELNLTVVHSSFENEYNPHQKVYLFEYKSDLYAVTKESNLEPEMDLSYMNMPMKLTIFKKIDDVWNYVSSMGDMVLFLGEDSSFCLSKEEVGGFKVNSVFLTDKCFGMGSVYGDYTGVYDFDLQMVNALALAQDYAKMFWPPPTWLMDDATTSGGG